MHDYEYINKPEELLTPEVAKIQSTGASNLGKITKREILTMAPDISEAMVEKVLAGLLAEGFIQKMGNGRGSGYKVVQTENNEHLPLCHPEHSEEY